MNDNLEARVNQRTQELQKEIDNRKRIESELMKINHEYERLVSAVPDFIWTGKLLPDGTIVWILDRETITRERDGSLRFNSIVSDITERKIMEEKLKEANDTKDSFLCIIAHDLKVPFNAIMGFSDLLREQFDEIDDTEKKSYIRNIINASDSAFKLLENLLEWSRAQTGRLEINPEIIDLSVLANNTIKVMKSGIGIDKDQIPNLFRIDKKVESEIRQGEGTGLGLILCKEFVENNGGTIWLESEKGKGTTFYFSLPAKPPQNTYVND